MRAYIALILIAGVTAECPNACSGHGTCGAKDSCSCYQNYQGNDCSERTCYFGIAHVDTPKGDLNADGYVSGPLTTVITGSEVYPWGTTEQFPNADANEGHFYMECSNKGICDRKSGECDCFDGYEGSACARASCPNECSGHGTCESIKELSELSHYDTTSHDVATTSPPTATDFTSSIDESYAYDLWDQDKTMGCKCDPVYYGPDCSLRKCKYGVDPLFFDDADGRIYQTTVVHLGSKDTAFGSGHTGAAGDIGGTFKIVFYDVFGEKYVTKPISAANTLVASDVEHALEALPNGVISRYNTDVTAEPTPAVQVSMQSESGAMTTAGCIGAGAASAAGIGLGVSFEGSGTGAVGPEFTVTFSTNPGVLKTIELDTTQVEQYTNSGAAPPSDPDEWVANVRLGQFESRYSQALGRVNTLKYGSRMLYTNSDWTSGATKNGADTLIKVGGQEARVLAATTYYMELSEEFLGASIIPTLTDTGATATAFVGATPQYTISAPATDIIANSLKTGATLYIDGCPVLSADSAVSTSATTLDVADTHDCQDFSSATNPIYRRTDDPDNQYAYRTVGDTSTATDTLILTRGSSDVYVVGLHPDTIKDYSAANGFKSVAANFDDATNFVAANRYFVNYYGPIQGAAIDTSGADVSQTGAADTYLDGYAFFGSGASWDVTAAFPMHVTDETPSVTVQAGNILLLNGRRYKVKEVDGARYTLTEKYAGGSLTQVCSACVTAFTVATGAFTTSVPVNVRKGDKLLFGGQVHEDKTVTATADSLGATSHASSPGQSRGDASLSDLSGTLALYKVSAQVSYNAAGATQAGYIGSLVTESSDAGYQYVSQCSNRGSCDSGTGVCKCFKGYSNDNCDTQNMLAM